MKNFFKLLGIAGMALVIGFSMAACGGGDDDDSSGKKGGGTALWRSELAYDPTHMSDRSGGIWTLTVSPWIVFSPANLNNGSAAYVQIGGNTYKLMSKDDKPIGQESSFNIKLTTLNGVTGNEYTVKYTLAADSLTINNNGGVPVEGFSANAVFKKGTN